MHCICYHILSSSQLCLSEICPHHFTEIPNVIYFNGFYIQLTVNSVFVLLNFSTALDTESHSFFKTFSSLSYWIISSSTFPPTSVVHFFFFLK